MKAGGQQGEEVGESCLENKPWLNASAALANTQGRLRGPEIWQSYAEKVIVLAEILHHKKRRREQVPAAVSRRSDKDPAVCAFHSLWCGLQQPRVTQKLNRPAQGRK